MPQRFCIDPPYTHLPLEQKSYWDNLQVTTLHGIRLILYVQLIVVARVISPANTSHYILAGIHSPGSPITTSERPTPVNVRKQFPALNESARG